MTDLRKAAEMALDAMLSEYSTGGENKYSPWDVIEALRQALAQPKYHRGDRLLCLESEEYCVIHISGTDRQWVKFPDSHIGAYTNEQVQELFELLPKETDEALAQPEQEPIGYLCENAVGHKYFRWKKPNSVYRPIALYAAPPKREWVGLTDDEKLISIWKDGSFHHGVEWAEAKLKEKNGA